MYYEKPKNHIHLDRNQLEFVCLEHMVPNDHILRKIENAIDFSFIHDLTKEYYSPIFGRPCLDTVILFKIVLLNFLMGKNSIRATLEDAKVNMAYRWFLGISMTEKVPNFSTFSQNYKRRYSDTDVFDKIFTKIIDILVSKGLIDSSVIFVDGTHIKANANKHKSIKKQIKVASDKYHKELEKEVNEFRELNGRENYKDDDDDEYEIDIKTGEIKEKENTKVHTVTVSTTDPDCGMFVKGQHERGFAYVDQVACDKNGWVLAHNTNPANMHDSKAFMPFFEEKLLNFNPEVICSDSAYNTALIAKNVQEKGINLLVPYSRQKGQKTTFGKRDFEYYYEIDTFMCPNKKLLEPWNISKHGYIEYRIHESECGDCPFKKECLKNYKFKTVRRHLYDDCLLLTRDYRLSPEGKEIYKKRKETIERVFAEGKERHCLRYSRYRGLKKNYHYRALLYSCLNIKKLGLLLHRKPNLGI